MKACCVCGQKFGLVRHRHLRKQFCSTTCKTQYLTIQKRRMAQRRNAVLGEARDLQQSMARVFG